MKKKDDVTPLVSVAIIAYNLEDFIEEAIESVLSQNCTFPFEIVVGEDCSTDKTREILLSYQKKHPDIIRVLEHPKNLGLTPNSIATQNACRGKYIAMLDGDDYWTDPDKLQIQVDFLENNEEYAGHGHQSTKIYEDGSDSELFGSKEDADLTLIDTLTHRKFHTSSLVYRRKIWEDTGGIPENISSNERAMYPMIAMHGKIRYVSRNMCIYRLSSINLSSRIDYKELERDLNMLPWFKKLDPKFPVYRFRSFLHLCMYTYGKKISFGPLMKHYTQFVFFSFSYFPKNLGDLKWGTIDFFKRLR